jgi:hypothetical protein
VPRRRRAASADLLRTELANELLVRSSGTRRESALTKKGTPAKAGVPGNSTLNRRSVRRRRYGHQLIDEATAFASAMHVVAPAAFRPRNRFWAPVFNWHQPEVVT